MKFAVKDKSIDLEKKYLELFVYTWDNNPAVNLLLLKVRGFLKGSIYSTQLKEFNNNHSDFYKCAIK